MIEQLIARLHDHSQVWPMFQTVFVVTLVTKLMSWAYFKGLFGQATPLGLTATAMGLDEFLAWLVGILGLIGSLIPMLWPAAPLTAAGLVAGLLGIAILLVALWIAVIYLAYHDLPRWLAHLVLGLMIGFTVLFVVVMFFLGALTPIPGDEILFFIAALLYGAFLAAILGLLITLLYKLARAAKNWLKKTWIGTLWRKWNGQPQTTTGGGQSATGAGVTNPNGATGSGVAVVPPETCVTVDFGSSSIEDHWGVADLRISIAPANANVSVEVSNDNSTWEGCTNEGGQDYDVPWWNSPWRYVRICNRSNVPIQISNVQDLSN